MEIDPEPFLHGWSLDQWRDLYGEVIALHTMLLDRSFNFEQIAPHAGRVYQAQPQVAMYSMLGFMVNRLAMLATAQSSATGGRARTVTVSARRLLASATGTPTHTAHACLAVVDEMIGDRLTPHHIETLVAQAGVEAFLALVFMGAEVGDLVVAASDRYCSAAELLMQEGLEAAQSWD